jgi:hypothetical protein
MQAVALTFALIGWRTPNDMTGEGRVTRSHAAD